MVTQIETKTLYDQDFCLWAETMANLLKTRQLDRLDYENLIEEIESMGRSEKRALKRNLEILLMHLLKWKYQTDKRSNSWKFSIREHRRRIVEALKDSPSLKGHLELVLADAYQEAREMAALETFLELETFPHSNCFVITEILDQTFLPD